jgi:hypothetical protein
MFPNDKVFIMIIIMLPNQALASTPSAPQGFVTMADQVLPGHG